MVAPIPTAPPSTAAIMGFLLLTSECRKATGALGMGSGSAFAAAKKSPISTPTVNTPERPVRIRQRMSGFDCAVSIASLIARNISCVSAFFFSGRRMTMVRVCSSSVTMMWPAMLLPRGALPVNAPVPHNLRCLGYDINPWDHALTRWLLTRIVSLSRRRPQAMPGIPDLVIVNLGKIVRRVQVEVVDVEPANGAQQRVGRNHPVALRRDLPGPCVGQVLLGVEHVD